MTDHDKTQAIRSILNIDWNPIGLSLSETDDKYDTYARYIAGHETWKKEELTNYLLYVEQTFMGLSIGPEREKAAQQTARKLLAIA